MTLMKFGTDFCAAISFFFFVHVGFWDCCLRQQKAIDNWIDDLMYK